jgi:fumarate hydratase subunit beta
MPKAVTTPLDDSTVSSLSAGDEVIISGVIYTARDVAHRKLCALIAEGEALPVDLRGQVIYFAGPAPTPPGKVIGSIGPTTSYRMDDYSPILMEKAGLKGMIGKGRRSDSVINAMKKFGVVYFAAIGGAGALIAQSVVSSEIVAYPELGPEAILRLVVKDLPAIVATDSRGNDLYASREGSGV